MKPNRQRYRALERCASREGRAWVIAVFENVDFDQETEIRLPWDETGKDFRDAFASAKRDRSGENGVFPGAFHSLWRRFEIPDHVPDRFETVDGLDNPRCPNALRVQFAREALQAFQDATRSVDDEAFAIGDLICDLLHCAHSMNEDPFEILGGAVSHFIAEAGPLPNSPLEKSISEK